MRRDLRPVLTHGRQRSRSRAYSRPLDIRDDDGLPVCRAREISKGEPHGYCKHRWAVLHRLMESCVGRPWSRVYSELCAALPPDLVRWHVDGRVETGCRTVDGELLGPDGRGVWGFYEDPVDGCLRMTPEHPWRPGNRRYHRNRHLLDPDVLPLDDAHGGVDRRAEIRRLEGVWYLFVHVRHAAPAGSRQGIRAVRDGRDVRLLESVDAKRQLATREIRDLRLAEWDRLARELRGMVERADDFARAASVQEGILAAARRRHGVVGCKSRKAGGR